MAMTTKCPRCHAESPLGSNFCAGCGARLAAACRACGKELTPAARFCSNCGTAVGDEPLAPNAYTPKHLADKILTSRSALEGERKQVTVLFADLKSSMELLAERDPEEARAILDPVLELMMDAVHRYEGTINQVMGDGIMALFGAPLAHEDHAVRACYAALQMQEAVKRHAAEVFRTHGVNVEMRIGLNSGDVVVRAIASDLRMDYSAVGQTTHLAARMEQLASPGRILITAETLRLAEGFVEVRLLGPTPVKGLSSAVTVYELTAPGAARTRLQAATARGLSRFVGRHEETEHLGRALEQAMGGHGQLVAIVGAPGVGKSRLSYEFTRSPRTRGCLVLETSAVSYGRSVPYLTVIEFFKRYLQIETGDDARRIREKVTGKLLALDRSLESTLPAFLALLDLTEEDADWQALDPAQRRERILDAVKRLLLHESRVQPLVLVFEDLHWIDGETQACLDSLVDAIAAARVLLLVTYRPEYRHEWGAKSCYAQLRIDPLPPAGAEGLLDVLLGGDESLTPLKRLLIEKTEGNPFFLEESVRTFVETNVLAGAPGAYRLTRALEGIQVPATVQAMLAARIDRLSPADKEILGSAAVIGKDLPLPLLRAAVDRPEEELQRSLVNLQSAEFLYEVRRFPELEYTFNHALTHEVAYASLLQERRRALHLKIFTALEHRPVGERHEAIDDLARHAVGGESWDKAARYLHEAGRRATTQSAYRAAVASFEEALVALERLPESRELLAQAIDLRLDLRLALVPLGQYEKVLDLMREAEELATRLGDPNRLGRVMADLCARLRNVAGEHAQALEFGRRALAIATQYGDRALEIEAEYRTGQVHFAIGDYRQAMTLLSRCASAGRSGPPTYAAAWPHSWLALTRAALGDFADAISHAKRAIKIAERVDHPFTRAEAFTALGGVHVAQGDVGAAIGALEQAIAVGQKWHIQPWSTFSRLGHAYALAGRLAEGLRVLEEVEDSVKTVSSMGMGRALHLVWLGRAYLLAGRVQDAAERAQQGLSLARRHHERGYEAWSLHLLADIAAHPDSLDVGTADAYYREAVQLATDLGMRPLVAHCHLGHGTLSARAGKPQEAHDHLARAAAMYREMDMAFWLEKCPRSDALGW